MLRWEFAPSRTAGHLKSSCREPAAVMASASCAAGQETAGQPRRGLLSSDGPLQAPADRKTFSGALRPRRHGLAEAKDGIELRAGCDRECQEGENLLGGQQHRRMLRLVVNDATVPLMGNGQGPVLIAWLPVENNRRKPPRFQRMATCFWPPGMARSAPLQSRVLRLCERQAISAKIGLALRAPRTMCWWILQAATAAVVGGRGWGAGDSLRLKVADLDGRAVFGSGQPCALKPWEKIPAGTGCRLLEFAGLEVSLPRRCAPAALHGMEHLDCGRAVPPMCWRSGRCSR